MAENALSIYLTDDSIQLIDTIVSNNQIEILDVVSQGNLPTYLSVLTDKATGDVSKVIEKLLTGMKTKKRNVSVIIPDSISYAQIVEMPKLKEKELLSAIRYQADQFIPMPIEKTTLDIEILYENVALKTLLVLIVAAPEDLVKKVEKLIELSGLVPDSIENELSASSRALTQFYHPTVKTGGSLFVNLGYNSSSLYFFDHALGLITDNHTFGLGLSLFLKEIEANLNIDTQKAKELLKIYGMPNAPVSLDTILEPVVIDLGREIEKFMIGARERRASSAIQSIQFFNQIDHIPGLAKKMAGHASVPLSVFTLEPYIKKTPLLQSYSSHLSSFTCAIGGTLR